jgi:general secretion pathway protein G
MSHTRAATARSGYTMIELLAVMLIIGFLAAFGFPKLHQVLEAAKVARAIGDIRAIQADLMSVETQNQPLPATLAGIGRAGMLDPWGNPYQYNTPAMRVDRFGVISNSTFDVYSMGIDGATAPSFTSATGLDDITRADDGFIGLASKF